MLAIPSVIVGGLLAKAMLYSGVDSLLTPSLTVLPLYNVLATVAQNYQNAWQAILQALHGLPFWFAVAGIVAAWINYMAYPKLPELLAQKFRWIYYVLVKQYGFDAFNEQVVVRCAWFLSWIFYHYGDEKLLDESIVDGSGRTMTRISLVVKRLQSGYLYHYAFVMILGLVAFLIWKVF